MGVSVDDSAAGGAILPNLGCYSRIFAAPGDRCDFKCGVPRQAKSHYFMHNTSLGFVKGFFV